MCLVRLIVGVLALCTLAAGQTKPPPGTLTLDEVVRNVRAGLSEELIIAIIKANAKPFNLNDLEIVELRRLTVSETIIRYLINPDLPYAPPPPPSLPPGSSASPVPPAIRPTDPDSVRVPPEVGLYFLMSGQQFVQLGLKPVVPLRTGGKWVSVLTAGLKKGHAIGSLAGRISKSRTSDHGLILYARLGEKTSVDDLVLLVLEQSETRRTIDFGPKADKPVFPVDAVRQIESKEVATGLYRLSVSKLSPGEYLFFILGSGDEKKGILGRGYEFGVDKPDTDAAGERKE